MTKIYELVTTGWHFARRLRLGFGVFLAAQAIQLSDVLSGVLAALFLFQAITNTGCCGAGGCAVPTTSKKENLPDQETVYEEVK
ncbi:MAG: hypothetical protein ACMVP2_21490 [Imperialibacter sp.]|uniref:hypothetical protein n=1 Tax=Imperialibacter sp. TaxID=2038411 RepID=UPI003A88D207